jgi:uncharacterized protein (TIGR03067 family)
MLSVEGETPIRLAYCRSDSALAIASRAFFWIACSLSTGREVHPGRPAAWYNTVAYGPGAGSGPFPSPEAVMRFVLFAAALSAGALAAQDKADDARKAFQGTWTIVDTRKGDPKDKEPVTARTVVFDGGKYRIKVGDTVVEEGTFTVDPSKSPKHIDVAATAGMDKGMKWQGIYELDGDTLRAVVGPTDKARPTKFENPAEGVRAFTLKRAKR